MYSLRSRKQNPDYCVGNSPEKRKFKRKSVSRAKHKDNTSDEDSESSLKRDTLKTDISGIDEKIPQTCSKTKLKCPKSVSKNKSEEVVAQSNDQKRKLRSRSVLKAEHKFGKDSADNFMEVDNEDRKLDKPGKEIIDNLDIPMSINQVETPNTKKTVNKNVEDSDGSKSSDEVEIISSVDDSEDERSNKEGDNVSQSSASSKFQVETEDGSKKDGSKSSSIVEIASDVDDEEDVNNDEDNVSEVNTSNKEDDDVSQICTGSMFQVETVDESKSSSNVETPSDIDDEKDINNDEDNVSEINTSNKETDDVSPISTGSMFQVESVDETKSSSNVETSSDIDDEEVTNNDKDSVSQINSTFQVVTIDKTIKDDSDDRKSNKKDVSFNISQSSSQFQVDNVDTEENNYRKTKQELGYISQINSSFQVETVNDKNDDNGGAVEDDILFEIDTIGKKDGEEDNIIKTVDSESDEEDGRNNLSQFNNLFQMDTVSEKVEDSEDEKDENSSEDEDDEEMDDDNEEEEEEDDGNTNQPIFKFPLNRNVDEIMKYSSGSSKKGFFNWDDTYLDIQLNTKKALEVNRDARKFSRVDEVMKKSTITPGFEKLHAVPSYDESDRILKKQRMKERERTKGSKWFNMPATEMTDEMKHDLEVIQMRSVLDPKHFYKKNDLKVLPKYFQVGKVEDNAVDFYNSRLPKKQRKRTIVEELLADSDFKRYNKKRYTEIIEERRKTHFKAHNHAKKLKKRKK
ncbi:hypothetical protein C0J52_14219 [Blattella germanica]|nr:hypothetical protein C0J52_14219 [Blattella germanica]